MKKLWKKFDDLRDKGYLAIVQTDLGIEPWNNAFSVLLDIISTGRERNPRFAREMYLLDDETEYKHDICGWVEDYLDELSLRGMFVECEAASRKVVDLFEWKEASPSELYFNIASALGYQEKFQEALSFCEEWYAKDETDTVAAAALIYARIGVKDWNKAEEIVKKYISEDGECTEENDIIYLAASALYKASGNKAMEKKMEKAIEAYEEELEREFAELEGDDIDFDLDADWDEDWDLDFDDEPDEETFDLDEGDLPF